MKDATEPLTNKLWNVSRLPIVKMLFIQKALALTPNTKIINAHAIAPAVCAPKTTATQPAQFIRNQQPTHPLQLIQ